MVYFKIQTALLSIPSASNSKFERKNGPGRTSESGHACPCVASVKCPLSDNPPGPSPLSLILELLLLMTGFLWKKR
jgi:hypothetical protein